MKSLLLALFLSFSAVAQGEIAVIVNPNNDLEQLTVKQVRDIFLGRARAFPNGKFAVPVDQTTSIRTYFYEQVAARPIEQINAYWARLIFAGRSSPPKQLEDDEAVLQAVKNNEDMIGYVDKNRVDDDVRLLLLIP